MSAHHPWSRRCKRRAIWMVVLAVTVPLVITAAVLGTAAVTGDWSAAQWLGLTGLAGFAGLGQLIWMIPARRKVIAAGGRVCGDCLFPLKGLGESGTCPECGHAFVLSETIEHWEKDMRLRGHRSWHRSVP